MPRPTLEEPKENGRTISYKMNLQALEEAREDYRAKAFPMFDSAMSANTNIDATIRGLVSCEKNFRDADFPIDPIDNDQLEGVVSLLALDNVVYHPYYNTWRGTGGNCRADPRFDKDETWDETPETQLRLKFIHALCDYCRDAATWAKELKCESAKSLFLGILSTLKSSIGPDPELGLSKKQSEKIVNDFVLASRQLWEEWQTELVRQGVIISKAEQDALLSKIEKSISKIEEIAGSAINQCARMAITQTDESQRIIMKAIGAIDGEFYRVFMPAALRYSEAEEATSYDESRISCAVLPLCEKLFGKDSPAYQHCVEIAERLTDQISHPIYNRFCIWKDPYDKGETDTFSAEEWMNLLTVICEANDTNRTIEDLHRKLKAAQDSNKLNDQASSRNAKGKKRKTRKFSSKALKFAYDTWQQYKNNPMSINVTKGRKVSKVDVFQAFKEKLKDLGIETPDDFKHAIDTARKQDF